MIGKRKFVGLVAAVLLGSLSAVGVGEPAAPASAQTPDTAFRALTPARIVDTRSDLGAPGPVGADRTVTVDVTGVGGVPETGVGAVVLNVTATNASEATFVTVFPTGAPRPTASNLNVVAGQTVPNLVIATVGAGGTVQLYNFAGTIDLVADVTGWFPADAGGFTGLTPARIVDTRSDLGAPGPVGADRTVTVDVTGVGGVPETGVGAVVLNVTATNASEATFVTVFPTGAPRPTASNLNVVAGQTVPNLVIATVGAGGTVQLYNFAGTIDLVADVTGWFPADAGGFTGLTPARILDTRSDLGAPGPVGADRSVTVDVTGVGGVPETGVGAVVLNVTATNASEATFVTVFPTGAPRPTASNLNVVAGQTVPNLVIATVGAGGTVQLYNFAGTLDLVADVTGWFPAGAPPAVATTELPEARTGAAYQTALAATGGTPPYTFAVTGLPAGITAEPAGTLGGVTGWVGEFTVTVIVTDAAGATAAAALTLTSRTTETVVTGIAHTCALPGDGTARCWGANSRGQLGDNSSTNSDVPVTVTGLSGVTAITAGDLHTCALVGDGTARCWGRNDDGQLGNGGFVDRDVPVTVTGLSGATAITAGGAHTCALVGDGTARCWGSNSSGQLGSGGVFGSDVPVTVAGLSGATAITAGGAHTCALLGDGTARCWGRNSSGQLGNGAGADQRVPVTVTGLSDATAITAGGAHTCALLGDGTARCWGRNNLGQLGTGGGGDQNVPVPVAGLSGATAIATGDAHTCAVLDSGTARCWGSNELGQLGDGTQVDSTIPVSVVGLTGANAVAGGEFHTCAHLGDGTARCWGGNNQGQLGDGSTISSTTPVTVIGFP